MAIEEYSWDMIQHWVSQEVAPTLSGTFKVPEANILKANLRNSWGIDSSFAAMLMKLIVDTPILTPLYSEQPTSVWELIYALRYALDYSQDTNLFGQSTPRDDRSYWHRTFGAVLEACDVSPGTSLYALQVLEWLCWDFPVTYPPAVDFMAIR
ncbi:MAG TPA: hypothetical protein PLD54_02700, partial [Candidatus Levybacteria bacterium]|nr:hypothetical protein [Candidatus Levybacteria bacterium]